MSVLRKKPYIEELIGELSEDELTRLLTVINAKGNPELVTMSPFSDKPLPSSAPSSVTDKIKLVNLALGSNSIYTGILVYHSTAYCGFIGTVAYENDIIKLFKLDVAKRKAEPINEKLTADELRRVIDDALEAGGGGQAQNVAKVYEASNITEISAAILDELKPGDVVQKITGNSKHTYVVSYKGEGAGTGICLTYTAAGYIETVSYDRSGSSWVYNSTDITEISAGLTDYALIVKADTLPTATAISPDFVQTPDGKLYRKKVTEGV